MISLYLRVSVPTSLALKSTFINSKRVQFLLGCPKAQMHGAILATTRHGGHFPNSTILSSTFSYSVFRIPRFTNSLHIYSVCLHVYVRMYSMYNLCVLMHVHACYVCA